jgi:nicotinic acid mononucleotide adenylyltransferase
MNPACCWTIASWTVPAAFPVARPTVDTLRELRAELGPSRPLAWLVGADSLLGLSAGTNGRRCSGWPISWWPNAGQPLQASVDGALGRALEGRWADNEQALFASPAGRILRLHHPLREESASTVRSQIATGGPRRRCCRRPWPTMWPRTACTAPPRRECRGRGLPV